MADAEKAKAREDSDKMQAKVTKEWQNFAKSNGRHAYKDLMEYIDATMAMYTKYAEEQAMPHPLKADEVIPLTNDMIAGLLQARRGCGMVKTYIQNRVDSDVVQPNKTK